MTGIQMQLNKRHHCLTQKLPCYYSSVYLFARHISLEKKKIFEVLLKEYFRVL